MADKKLIAEQIHLDWQSEVTDRRLIIVRPAVVFGSKEGSKFTRLANLLKKGFFIFPGRKDTEPPPEIWTVTQATI